MRTRMALLALLCAAPSVGAQDVAGLAGKWTLNREQSQDLAAQIREAAGSEHMKGGASWARDTWLPWNTDFGEPERLTVREFLLATVPAFDALEIQQRGDEIETVHGEAGLRRFNLARKSAGTSPISGEKVRREARLEEGRLVLDSKGDEGRFRETFALEDSGARLVYTLRLEQKRLKAPLEARLVYDRAP